MKNIIKNKPNVDNYDYKPYSYINALTKYINELENALTIADVSDSEQTEL